MCEIDRLTNRLKERERERETERNREKQREKQRERKREREKGFISDFKNKKKKNEIAMEFLIYIHIFE